MAPPAALLAIAVFCSALVAAHAKAPGANCDLLHDGQSVSESSWDSFLNVTLLVGNLKDDTPPGEVYLPLTTDLVTGLKVDSGSPYISVVLDTVASTLQLVVTENFISYEEDMISSSDPTTINIETTVTCSDGKSNIFIFKITVQDINNHVPEFEWSSHEYELPMPLPSSIDLSCIIGVITVQDIDITNSAITVEFDEEGAKLLQAVATYQGNRQYAVRISSRTAIELTETTSFTMTATDNGVDPLRSEPATITIKVDQETSPPAAPKFQQPALHQTVTAEDITPGKQIASVTISEGYDTDVKVTHTTLDDEGLTPSKDKFALNVESGTSSGTATVTLSWADGVTSEDIEDLKYALIVVEATRDRGLSATQTATTVIHLSLPGMEDQPTTACPTPEPTTCPEPDPCICTTEPPETTTQCPEPDPCICTTKTPETTTQCPEPDPCNCTTSTSTSTAEPTTCPEPEPCPTVTPDPTQCPDPDPCNCTSTSTAEPTTCPAPEPCPTVTPDPSTQCPDPDPCDCPSSTSSTTPDVSDNTTTSESTTSPSTCPTTPYPSCDSTDDTEPCICPAPSQCTTVETTSPGCPTDCSQCTTTEVSPTSSDTGPPTVSPTSSPTSSDTGSPTECPGCSTSSPTSSSTTPDTGSSTDSTECPGCTTSSSTSSSTSPDTGSPTDSTECPGCTTSSPTSSPTSSDTGSPTDSTECPGCSTSSPTSSSTTSDTGSPTGSTECPECPTTCPTTSPTSPTGSPTGSTECPVCPTTCTPCEPCPTAGPTTTTTELPPGPAIEFEKERYALTVASDYKGLLLDLKLQDSAAADGYTLVCQLDASDGVGAWLAVEAEGSSACRLSAAVALPAGSYPLAVVASLHGTSSSTTAQVALAVSATVWCNASSSVGFLNALLLASVPENPATPHSVVPAAELPADARCSFSASVDPARYTEWVTVNETTGEVLVTDADYEQVASLVIWLQVSCDPGEQLQRRRADRDLAGKDQPDWPRELLYDETKMSVLVQIEDVNDNAPIFTAGDRLVVGYPTGDLLQRVQPGPVVTLTATDADEGENAELRFGLDAAGGQRFAVQPQTGAVYVRAALPAEGASFTATVADLAGAEGALTDSIQVLVKPLEREELVLVTTVRGALPEDAAAVVQNLSSATGLAVGLLRAYAAAPEASRSARAAEADGAALTLMLYALDDQEVLVSVDDFQKLLSSSEVELPWEVSKVQNLPPEPEEQEPADVTGYMAAIIALAVLIAVAVVAVGAGYYFYFRPRLGIQKKKGGYTEFTSDVDKPSPLESQIPQITTTVEPNVATVSEIIEPVNKLTVENNIQSNGILPPGIDDDWPRKRSVTIRGGPDDYDIEAHGEKRRSESSDSLDGDGAQAESEQRKSSLEGDEVRAEAERRKSTVHFNENVECIEVERL